MARNLGVSVPTLYRWVPATIQRDSWQCCPNMLLFSSNARSTQDRGQRRF
ncbi:MAG: hypothetical protein KDI66_03855 [Xanthomonadales bacterium]|nr:hypothetical protein [Xanthomonadales bacterium]MCB9124622.1 hypothetical protein [Caldilineaceae bacterium]